MTSKRKRGRPVGPNGHRVQLKRRTFVDPKSQEFLLACQRGLGVPFGRTIDAMIAYIRERKDFKLPLKHKLPHIQTFNPANNQTQTDNETQEIIKS